MSNKHKTNNIKSVSLIYFQTKLGPRKPCPKRTCSGLCVEVLVRYKDHGPVNHEFECTVCGKVIKDPKFKEERERRWKQKRNINKYNKKYLQNKQKGNKKNDSNARPSGSK